jgi:hypothetical protein
MEIVEMKSMVRYVMFAVAGLSLGVCATTSQARDTDAAESHIKHG